MSVSTFILQNPICVSNWTFYGTVRGLFWLRVVSQHLPLLSTYSALAIRIQFIYFDIIACRASSKLSTGHPIECSKALGHKVKLPASRCEALKVRMAASSGSCWRHDLVRICKKRRRMKSEGHLQVISYSHDITLYKSQYSSSLSRY